MKTGLPLGRTNQPIYTAESREAVFCSALRSRVVGARQQGAVGCRREQRHSRKSLSLSHQLLLERADQEALGEILLREWVQKQHRHRRHHDQRVLEEGFKVLEVLQLLGREAAEAGRRDVA